MPARKQIQVGAKFGPLVVIETDIKTEQKHLRCRVRCDDCGTESLKIQAPFIAGKLRNCAVCYRGSLGKRTYRHGSSGAEWNSFRAMHERCGNPNYHAYARYGGRGIKVCERWSSRGGFLNFLTDMGRKPTPQHSLDRIDLDGSYGPENCRWATHTEQMRNRSISKKITAFGETKTLAEWSEVSGCNRDVIAGRIRKGASPETAIAFRGALTVQRIKDGSADAFIRE